MFFISMLLLFILCVCICIDIWMFILLFISIVYCFYLIGNNVILHCINSNIVSYFSIVCHSWICINVFLFRQAAVAINIQIGHTARVLKNQTESGFTHEWSVSVQGHNNLPIAEFVEKVVFILHESFQKPRRSK